MKKFWTILIAALAFSFSASARFSTSISWGYCPQIAKYEAACYIPNSIGYRVAEEHFGFAYYSNAYLYLSVGADFFTHWSVQFKSGYMGIDYNYRALPIMGEVRYYFKDYLRSGLFLGAEGGIMLHNRSWEDKGTLAAFTFGHREQLYGDLSIDFTFKIQWVNYAPLPLDKIEGVIPRPQVIYTNTDSFMLGCGISINF